MVPQKDMDNGTQKKEYNPKTVTIPEITIFTVDDESSEDMFWSKLIDIRNLYYVLSFWCIGWNIASLMFEPTYYLLPTLIIILGLLTIACGFYIHSM